MLGGQQWEMTIDLFCCRIEGGMPCVDEDCGWSPWSEGFLELVGQSRFCEYLSDCGCPQFPGSFPRMRLSWPIMLGAAKQLLLD